MVDIGSGTTRVSLCTAESGIIAQTREQTTIGARIDVNKLWLQLQSQIAALTKRYQQHDINGICVSSLLGWVAINSAGHPIDDGWTWMHQERQAYSKYRDVVDQDIEFRMGRRFNTELAVLKLVALQMNYPQKYSSVATFMSIKDFINFKFTGNLQTDHVHAAFTGLFSVGARMWDGFLAQVFNVDIAKFPVALPSTSVIGCLNPNLAERLGLNPGTPVVNGGPDGSLAVLGGGGIHHGDAVDVMGTTDVFYGVSRHPILNRGTPLVTNPHVLPDLWLVGGAMGMTGGTVKWFVEQVLGESDESNYKILESTATDLEPGAGGVTFIPSLTGERAPTWLSEMRGTVLGLAPYHSKGHIYRAILEGVSYSLKSLTDILEENGHGFQRIVCIGGAAQSHLALQIKADVIGKDVCVPILREATTLGACILCAIAIDQSKSITELVERFTKPSALYVPNSNGFSHYQCHFETYRSALKLLGDFYQNNNQYGAR